MTNFVAHTSPLRRARLHNETCTLLAGGGSDIAPTGMSVPFDNIDQAEAYMDLQFSHFIDRARCDCCQPRGVKTRELWSGHPGRLAVFDRPAREA